MPVSDAQEDKKIFVGALAGQTTEVGLREYFGKYGEVIDAVVMLDKVTQHSRGFGFVTFSDPASVQVVLDNRPHYLDNKKIDPKPCTPKDIQLAKRNAQIEHIQTHKIFLGGISKDATEEDVKQYFQKFGEVTEIELVIDEIDRKHKGFGFLTFQDASAVDEVVKVHYHEIKGKAAESKRAKPRDKILTGTVRPPHKQDKQFHQHTANYNDGYGGQFGNTDNGMGAYGYGAPPQGPSGGWMPSGPPPMMNNMYGYNYYGYSYGPAPMRGGGHGNAPGGNDGHGQSSSYGPVKSGSYGYNHSGNGSSDRRMGGPGFHPYKR